VKAGLEFDRLTLGPFETNTYLLWCEETKQTAVVDVGFEAGVVIGRLRRRGLSPSLLLNTHAHYDHVCGMRDLQRELGGEYWLHPGDRVLLEHLAEQAAADHNAGAPAGLAMGCRPPRRRRGFTTWRTGSASRSGARCSRSSTRPATRPAA